MKTKLETLKFAYNSLFKDMERAKRKRKKDIWDIKCIEIYKEHLEILQKIILKIDDKVKFTKLD